MTRKEAIEQLQKCKDLIKQNGHEHLDERDFPLLDIAIEALEREDTDEWCYECKEYDTKKKCCPRFNRVIRGAMNREPSEDGTLEVKVEDATKVGRVLISDDKHRGGLYYPDEDEPQGVSFENDTEIKSCSKDSDLISRAEAYRRITELSRDLLSDDCINLGNASEYLRIIRELPSADRPRGEWIHTPNGTDRDFVWWVCSECGHKIFSETEKDRIEFHAYCGRCGADMRATDREKSKEHI